MFAILSGVAQAQNQPSKDYWLAVGVVGTTEAAGVQAELRLPKNFSVRLAGLRVLSYERDNEYGYLTAGLLTYTFSSSISFLEPSIGLGGTYYLYHWNEFNRQGNFQDLSGGGGLGLNFRFSERFRAGVNLYLINIPITRYDRMRNTVIEDRRQWQGFPTLTLDFQFLR